MRQTLLSLIYLLLLFSIPASSQSVVYPVQLQVQLLPPYTPCLSDYLNADFSRLRVIALQRDMSQPNYIFALKMTIKQGNQVVLQTDVNQLYTSNGEFTVQPGIATVISGSELRNLLSGDLLKKPKDYEQNGLCLVLK